jgi:hypothetical protein
LLDWSRYVRKADQPDITQRNGVSRYAISLQKALPNLN